MSDPPPGWRKRDGPLASVQRGSGPRLVFVHGFTQTGRSWLPVAERFTDTHEVVLVDAPGHGGSGDVDVDLIRGAELLAEVGGVATYVGYSMGGRLCLHLAVEHLHLVTALVVIGATAGIEDITERAERRRADDRLADEIESGGVDEFLRKWLAAPLFATLPDAARGLQDRRLNTATGLASSLRRAGTASQESLWNRVAAITAPTLVMAGALDEKFTAIGQRLVNVIGSNATFATVPAAGHAAHLEQPAAVASAIQEWLQRIRLNG